MSFPRAFKLNKKSLINISFPRDDCNLALKIYPDKYFYRYSFYILQSQEPKPDMRGWTDLIKKKEKMIHDAKFKSLFKNIFLFQLDDFLKHIQKEAEIEYENEQSLKQIAYPSEYLGIIAERRISSKPLVSIKPLLDLVFEKDEDYVFKYIEEYGPGLLQNKTISVKIREWISSRNKNKLQKLFRALKRAALISPGPEPLTGTDIIRIEEIYPHLLKEIQEMKKNIFTPLKADDLDEDAFSSDLHKKLNEKKYGSYKTLIKVLEREKEPNKKISNFLKTYPPWKIACKLLGYEYNRDWSAIHKIIRMKNKPRDKSILLY